VEGKACGDAQQPVAQALGLCACALAGQQQSLGPGDEVVGDEDEHPPDAVVLKFAKRHVGQDGVLVVADMRLGVRALRWRRSSS
jgi:hypothetical protein